MLATPPTPLAAVDGRAAGKLTLDTCEKLTSCGVKGLVSGMLQRTPIGTSPHDGHGYPISADDIDNAKIAFVIIAVVFGLQLAFAALALLLTPHA